MIERLYLFQLIESKQGGLHSVATTYSYLDERRAKGEDPVILTNAIRVVNEDTWHPVRTLRHTGGHTILRLSDVVLPELEAVAELIDSDSGEVVYGPGDRFSPDDDDYERAIAFTSRRLLTDCGPIDGTRHPLLPAGLYTPGDYVNTPEGPGRIIERLQTIPLEDPHYRVELFGGAHDPGEAEYHEDHLEYTFPEDNNEIKN